jgi:hypothetical protein
VSSFFCSVEGRHGSSRYGSAIAVSDHEAVTNCHIVAQADVRLTLGGNKSGEGAEAELVAIDFDTSMPDMAIPNL